MSDNFADLLARLNALPPEERAQLLALLQSGGANLGIANRVERMGDVVGENQAKGMGAVAKNYGVVINLVFDAISGARELPDALDEIRSTIAEFPAREFDGYQAIAAGLGRANIAVTIDAQDEIRMRADRSPDAQQVDLRPFQELLAVLRQAIFHPDPQTLEHDLAARRERYREQIANAFCSLRLEGLSTGTEPIRLPLEKVYVQLRAVAQVPEAADTFTPEERRLIRTLEESHGLGPLRDHDLREIQLRLDALRRDRWTRERSERFPISRALADPHQRGLVILGDPGSGKSTLLQFLALIFAWGPDAVTQHINVSGPDADRLPIFAPLASYDAMLNETPHLTIAEFLVSYYDRHRSAPGLGPIFQRAIASGRALILLDGLDEVVDEGRRKFVAEQVSSFVQSALPHGNRVVLTSRIYGYRTTPLSANLPHVTVLDFGKDEIRTFARQWFRAFKAWEARCELTPQMELLAQQEERALLDEIAGNPGVERLAVNPLLLTMLTLLRQMVGKLPQRRITLYDEYVRALVLRWEENRSRGARLRSDAREARIDLREAEGALLELALWLQQHRPSGTATYDDLHARLVVFYLWEDQGLRADEQPVKPPQRRQAEKRADAFLEAMRTYSGLLIERGQNAFGFRHLTFQEYFAGRALAVKSVEERWALLAPNLHSNRWREPLLLCAARLGVTDKRDTEATGLVRQVLEAGSEHEPLLHRDLFLAADCAGDDIGIELPLLQRIADMLLPLLEARVPAIVRGAVERLERLCAIRAGDAPRLPETQQALFEFVLKQARSVYYVEPDSVEQQALAVLQRLIAEDTGLRANIAAKLDSQDWQERRVGVQALAPLLATHTGLRTAVLSKLDDKDEDVKVAVIEALSPLLSAYTELREIILSRLKDPSWSVRRAAVRVVGTMAESQPDLRPLIFTRLDDPDNDVRQAAVEALGKLLEHEPELRQPLIARLEDRMANVRQAAMQVFAPFLVTEPGLRAAIVASLDTVDTDTQIAAIRALAPLLSEHDELRIAVIAKLNSSANDVCRAAIEALGEFLYQDQQITDQIVALLKHRDWRTRSDMLLALAPGVREGHINADVLIPQYQQFSCAEADKGRVALFQTLSPLLDAHPDLLMLVIARLNHQDSVMRRTAVQILSPLVLYNSHIQSLVTDCIDDVHWSVRQEAILAIGPLLATDPDLLARVQTHLNDQDEDVCRSAIEVLAPLLANQPDLQTLIVARLNDEYETVRSAAIDALRPLLADHADVRELFASLLNHRDWSVRRSAVRALGPLLGDDSDFRNRIVALLDDDDWDVQQSVAEALSPFLSSHTELRELVVARLDDINSDTHSAIIRTLGLIFAEHADLRDLVVARLTNERANVRVVAVTLLGPLLADHADIRALVTARLDDPDVQVRWKVVELLAPLLTEHAELHDLILARLDDEIGYVRSAAVAALAPLLPTRPDLRARYETLLQDGEKYVRLAAVAALGPLLADHSELQQVVRARLSDESWEVRLVAVQALGPLLNAHVDLKELIIERLSDTNSTVRVATIAGLIPFIDQDLALFDQLFILAGPGNIGSFHFTPTLTPPMVDTIIRDLTAACGRVVQRDPERRARVVEMLGNVDWRRRKAAAEILTAAGPEYVLEALPQLIAALDDQRGLDSWPARIAAAELLINDPRHGDGAVDLILPALTYATDEILPVKGAAEVRKQAALALGKLKAVYRRRHVAERIAALLETEREPAVLDGLYNALSSLIAAPEQE